MDNEGLEDILNDTPAEEVQDTEAATTEAPETIGRERDEMGRFKPKQETGETEPQDEPAAEVAPPAAEPVNVPVGALQDERRKRQDLERRLAYYEQQLQARQAQPQQAPAPPVDFWEDPNTFLDSRLNEFGSKLIQQFEQQQQLKRVNEAEAAARARYTDFDEAVGEFTQAAQQNPRLIQEMAASPDPAEFAYRRGKQMSELAQVGDLDAYKAKVIAEYEAQLKASLPSPVTAPTTTAGLRSVGARPGPNWTGATPIEDILQS